MGLPLPVGVSDFRKLVEYRKSSTGEAYLYVDKTKFIKAIDDDGAEVIVITRPRRFGKTLNISMLQYFYAPEVDGISTKGLFDHLNISKYKDIMKNQGSCPVLFISFKDIEADDLDEFLIEVSGVIRDLYEEHDYLLESDKLPARNKKFIEDLLDSKGSIGIENIKISLQKLTFFFKRHFGKDSVVLIDEYDGPIQKAYSKNYYEKIISIFRGMFSRLLKGNKPVKKAMLTGVVRVSRESLFSSVNNLEVYSVMHNKYSEYFGFTESEVKNLLKAKKLFALNEAKDWYNGYKFGNSIVYNPWSIIKFIKDEGELKSYWINTSSNDLAESLIINASPIIKESIEKLMSGEATTVAIDEHVVFKDLDRNEGALWSLLLGSGYLMAISKVSNGRYYRAEIKIPNLEVLDFYTSTVQKWISTAGSIKWFEDFVAALMSGKAQSIEKKIQDIMKNTMSYHDTAADVQESFFHGLMLGVVAGLKDEYKIKSNRESGQGRYDVALFPNFPNNKNKPGIVMEFKAENTKEDISERLAKIALKQLGEKDYKQELIDAGCMEIISLGIGFTKNKVCVLDVGNFANQ